MATLQSAELWTRTASDNKDKDTGIYINVYTSDDKTELCNIANADNSDKDATEYNDGSEHTVKLTVLSASEKEQCGQFKVKMSSKAKGNDKWKIKEAKVILYFSDGKNLIATKNDFELNSKDSKFADVTFQAN